MVKSKIEARERALELAISWGKVRDVRPRDIIECAEEFAKLLLAKQNYQRGSQALRR